MQEVIDQFKQDFATLTNNRIEFYFSRCNSFEPTRLKAYHDNPYPTNTTIILGKISKTFAIVLNTSNTNIINQFKNLMLQDYGTLTINHQNQLILLYQINYHQMDALYWIQFKQQDMLFDLPITVLYEDQLVLGPSYYNTNDIIKQSTVTNDTILQLPHVIIKELQRTNKSLWLQVETVSRKDMGLPDVVTQPSANDVELKLPKTTNDNSKVQELKLLKPSLEFNSDFDTTLQDYHALFKFNNAVFNLDTYKIRPYYPHELESCPQELPQTINEIKRLVTKLRSQTSGTTYMQLDTATLNHCKSQVSTVIKAVIPNQHQHTRLFCMLAQALASKGDQRYVHVWTGIDDVGKLILVQFIQWLFGHYCCPLEINYLTTNKADRKHGDISTSGITKQCLIAISPLLTCDVILKPTKLQELYNNPLLTNTKFNIIIPTQYNVSISPSRSKSLSIKATNVVRYQSFDVAGDMAELDYIKANISREVVVGFFHVLLDHYEDVKEEQ